MATAAATPIPLNAHVQVAAGTGRVRFVGQTAFAAGKWIGIELDEQGTGKNDGTVQGKPYFTLEKHGTLSGVFVRPSQVQLLDRHDASVHAQDDREEEVFAVPALPKSRPASSASGVSSSAAAQARANLVSPTTPGAASTTGTRRLSARPLGSSAAASPAPSPRASLSRTPSSLSSASSQNATSASVPPPARTRLAGGAIAPSTPRVPSGASSASPSSSAGPSRRESLAASTAPRPLSASTASTATASSATPRKPPAEARSGAAARISPATPRSVLPASGLPSSAMGKARPVTPRTESASRLSAPPANSSRGDEALSAVDAVSSQMQRNVSSSSSASTSSAMSAASLARASTSARIQSLQRQQSYQRTRHDMPPSQPLQQEDGETDQEDGMENADLPMPPSATVQEGEGSPSHQSMLRRQSKASSVSIDADAERTRFSLQPPAVIASSSASAGTAPEKQVPLRAHEELQLRYRLLEAGRAEDRERLKEMERLKEDSEAYALARPKLQAKLVELAGEVKELRRERREHEAEREELQRKVDEAEERLEMEMLDKEMAEEKLEQENAALEAAREKVAELEVELDVMRKEETRIVSEAGGPDLPTDGSAIGRDSLAFIQLAKQNERLKEALMRLRDLTSLNEQEYKRRVLDLEKELDLTADLQASFDATVEQLEQAESMVENLKLQLDDAMGAEDMLEHLTERNLTLSERIEEMHAVIQDLEALKELNDELEENHIENEKQMQEELDLKEYHLREQRKQLDTLEDGILDYEGTVSQFRELVVSLQGDIEHLRDQHQSQQTEQQSLSSQSQAMLNLNLKLQSTVLRNQSKTVDFELRKFEAQQARRQLSILTPYLPAAFHEEDRAAIDALLFFERLGAKTEILLRAVDAVHGLSDGAFPETVSDTLVPVCEARTKLARFTVLCRRFTVNLQRCDPPTFVKMGRVYVELAGMEKRIDSLIELAKKSELREAEAGAEIERFIAQTAHVAESHLGESGLDYGEQQLGLLLGLDLDLDTFVAGVGYAKQTLALLVREADVSVETGGADIDEVVFARLQGLVDSARTLKTASRKLVRRIEEVSVDSCSLRTETSESFQTASVNMRSIAVFASKLSDLVSRYTLEVRTSREPFQLSTFVGITQEAAADVRSQSKDLLGVEVVLRNLQQALTPAVSAALEPENVVRGIYEAPWVSRVAEMHSSAARDLDAEQKVIKLSEDVKDLAREIRAKDQTIQEASVKIELLEKRTEGVKRQADALAAMEGEVVKAREQERELERTVEQLQQDYDGMAAENAKLKLAVPAEKAAGPGIEAGEYTTFTGSLEVSHLVQQIETLGNTVRFLRRQNAFFRSQELFKDFNQLPAYESVVPRRGGAESDAARQFREETAALHREVATLSSRARVVDLNAVDPKKAWQPAERQPSAQLAAKRAQLLALKARVDDLTEQKKELAARRRMPSIVRL